MKYTTTQKKAEKAPQVSVANTKTKKNVGFSLEDNRATTVVQQQKINKIQHTKAQPIQLKKKGMRARIREKLAKRIPLTDRENKKAISLGILQDHEHTHRNIPDPAPPLLATGRRGSVTEANLLDTIHPSASIPHTGLNLADFRARFQPLVQGGNISTARLTALLPKHKAVAFPPARGGGADEIRAGRKWEIPNPDGGTHSIWVHTNDPRQDTSKNAGAGPIVRVQDSSGRYLSNVEHVINPAVDAQKDKNEQTRAAFNKAQAEAVGHWTTYHKNRTESQHIPLV
ncbi:hypothetical protein U8527_02500 [Kordia algicida OT-1]|uniref:Uncharacterized protein n=1 Tax=Kordia algicida OT-1 TaxID=391587 RepID=A9DNF9_9FLAO|nr:hypothetical protein [Kordia algicida]EDP97181.1 hypothetical protein KAOT1_18502 [Kordia algicida OT-1]